MTTARVTLLSSCGMSLNMFLMVFYSWCWDVTWLSLGDSISLWFSVCLGKYPGRALLQLAFEDGTLWTPDVGNCLLPTRTAIWGCAVHFLKWLFLTRRTTPHCWQPSVEQISLELVEITGSKGRSQRLSFFSHFSLSLIFIQVTGICLTYLKEHVTKQSSNIFTMKTQWGNQT